MQVAEVKLRASLLLAVVWPYLLSSCGAEDYKYHLSESRSEVSFNGENGVFHSKEGWAGSVPFYLEVNVPDQVVEASIKASLVWNDAIGHEQLVFMGVIERNRGETLYASLDDDFTVIYHEGHWSKGTGKSESVLATTVWETDASGVKVVRADIILNAEHYYYTNSLAPPSEESSTSSNEIVDTESILTHEFGHLLGLNHISVQLDPHSVMNPKTPIGPYAAQRNLSELDIENIQTLYID